MGFDQLKKNVQKKAEEEKKGLIDEAKQKAEKIRSEAQEECDKLEKDMRQEVAETTEQMKKQAEASAKLEVKKRALSVRKEMIETAFEKAREEIPTKPGTEDRENLIKGLLRKAEAQLTIARVHCNQTDAAFVQGYPTHDMDILGGLVAEDENGEYRIDLTFENLLEEIKEKRLSRINESLFV